MKKYKDLLRKRSEKTGERGFTLAEVLIVIAILGILFAFGFVAVSAHMRNLKRMEMDECAQEIFVAAQNHLTAAKANGRWDEFYKTAAKADPKTGCGTKLSYEPTDCTDKEAAGRLYAFSYYDGSIDVGADNTSSKVEAAEIMLPEGSIDETLRGYSFYVEYDPDTATVYGVFYTYDKGSDGNVIELTSDIVQSVNRTDPSERKKCTAGGKTNAIIGYYGGAASSDLKNADDLYAPSVAVRNAESLVLYVVDKNYYRPTKTGSDENYESTITINVTGKDSKASRDFTVDPKTLSSETDAFHKAVTAEKSKKKNFEVNTSTDKVYAEYYTIVLDSIVRDGGHFAEIFGGADENGKFFEPGEDITVTVAVNYEDEKGNKKSSDSASVTVNSLFNSVEKEKSVLNNGSKTVTVSNVRHLQNLSREVSNVDIEKIVTAGTKVSIIRDLFWDEDEKAVTASTGATGTTSQENGDSSESAQTEIAAAVPFMTAITEKATGINSEYGYNAYSRDTAVTNVSSGNTSANAAKAQSSVHVYLYKADSTTSSGNTSEGGTSDMSTKAAGSASREHSLAGTCYGISNQNIAEIEGNNHTLAAFRFYGKMRAALVNYGAKTLNIQNLLMADCTSAVAVAGTESTGSSKAAILIAEGYSGTIQNVQFVWYQHSGTEQNNYTTEYSGYKAGGVVVSKNAQNEDIAAGVYANGGAAAIVIGSLDAKGTESGSKYSLASGRTNGDDGYQFTNVTVETKSDKTLANTKGGHSTSSSSDVPENAVPLGIEGETASVLIGEVKSGKVDLKGKLTSDKNQSSIQIIVDGDLNLIADKGTAVNRAAGVMTGKVSSSATDSYSLENVLTFAEEINIEATGAAGGLIGAVNGSGAVSISQNVDLTARVVRVTSDGQTSGQGNAGGLIGAVAGNAGAVTIGQDSSDSTGMTVCAVSANTIEVSGRKAAGGAIGSISKGTAALKGIQILTPKSGDAESEIGQTENEDTLYYGIRVTAEKGNAGGLVGTADSNTAKLTIQNCAVSGSGTHDEIKAGTSAGGLVGSSEAQTTEIKNSMASMYVRAEGNGGVQNSSIANAGAGGLVGTVSGTVNIEQSYSGGRTKVSEENTAVQNPGTVSTASGGANTQGDSQSSTTQSAAQTGLNSNRARYQNSAEGQGRYNVYLANGTGAAGGLIGSYTGTTGSLTISSSYSTSSVAVPYSDNSTSGAAAGGLIGRAESGVTANNTYATGRVYAAGAGTTAEFKDTQIFGCYAGKIGGTLTGSSNYYLDNMKGAPENGVGSVNGTAGQSANIAETTLKAADYYGDSCEIWTKLASISTYRYADCVNLTNPKDSSSAATTTEYRFNTYDHAATATGLKRDPATGELNTNSNTNNASGTEGTGTVTETGTKLHIGDWEVPDKKSGTGYGLIYYEKVLDVDDNGKGTKDPTFYYHGYLYKSGSSAADAEYQEICSTTKDSSGKTVRKDFDTAANHYVIESGYLLLISKDNTESLELGYGSYGTAINSAGHSVVKLADLPQYTWDASDTASNAVIDGTETKLSDYTAYDVTLSAEQITSSNSYLFTPTSKTEFGTVLTVREKTGDGWQYGTAKAAFVYTPFFADALTAAEKGNTKASVSKNADNSSDASGAVKAHAVIRSAAQLQYLAAFDTNWNGYLTGGTGIVVEQQMDISYNKAMFDQANVTLQNGTKTIEVNGDTYKSPTFSMIHANAEYRSKVREGSTSSWTTINGTEVYDYYVLNGLTAPFVSAAQDGQHNGVQGKLDQLQITNMKALYFVESVNGSSAEVSKVTINDAEFGASDAITDGGFTKEVANGGTIDSCNLVNATVYGNGFVGTNGSNTQGTIKNCAIVNAIIWKNGFAEVNKAKIENCGIYVDTDLYTGYADRYKYTIQNYKPLETSSTNKGHGNYDYVAIGITKNGSVYENANIAGFVQSQTQTNASIKKCYVAGTVYGSQNVAGFIGDVNGSGGSTVEDCYANVVITGTAQVNVSGFAFEVNEGSKVKNCHALGRIETGSDASTASQGNAAGLIYSLNNGKVTNSYEAFWYVKARTWSPVYHSAADNSVENSYYLLDCKSETKEYTKLDYDDHQTKDGTAQITDCTYEELRDLNASSLGMTKAGSDKTKPYRQYLRDNSASGLSYPFPMTDGMTAYGDWNYEEVNQFTFLYYEKLTNDDTYYIHGYTTDGSGTYNEVATTVSETMKNSGVSETDGLMHASGKTVASDGYVLIVRKASDAVKVQFQTVTGSNSSSQLAITDGSITKFLQTGALSTDVQTAIKKAAGVSKNSTVYSFDPEQYLSFKTGEKNADNQFAGWMTYAQAYGGTGMTLTCQTTGSDAATVTRTAKFSFLPIFADTVNKPNGDSFASVRKSADSDGYNYLIRSKRQLKILSDWDAGMWNDGRNSKGSGTISLANLEYTEQRQNITINLKDRFDKDGVRYSYLSTSTTFDSSARSIIRQDLDVDMKADSNGENVNFASVEGTYEGTQYTSDGTTTPVKLIHVSYDFADTVSSSGKIQNLVVDQADYVSSNASRVAATSTEPAHGKRQEFVEYNYGTLSNITVQNSTLASAGLIYQNGGFTSSKFVSERYEKKDNEGVKTGKKHSIIRWIWEADIYKDQKATRYKKTEGSAQTGVITDCHVVNSQVKGIKGAGLAWNNYAGTISDSTVEATNGGAMYTTGAGFVQNNIAKEISTQEYRYDNEYYWTVFGIKIPIKDSELTEKGLVASEYDGDTLRDGSEAVIENCAVKNIAWANGDGGVGGAGFVGKNSIEASSTTDLTFKAEVKNCKVVNATVYGYGFVEENSGGAVISNSQIYAGAYGTDYKGDYGESSIGTKDNSTSAGFAGTNAEGSVIEDCSFTGQVQGKGTVGGFALLNEGTIRRCYANAKVLFNETATVGCFVYENSGSGTIEYCHTLGTIIDRVTAASGFVWKNDSSATIKNSYTAISERSQYITSYYPFAYSYSSGNFTDCYAMATGSSVPNGVSYVDSNGLINANATLGGKTATAATTVAYSDNLKGQSYPFPVSSDITNYGDWSDKRPSASSSERTAVSVTLDAAEGEFPASVVMTGEALSTASEDGENSEKARTLCENAISTASLEDELEGSSTNGTSANSLDGVAATNLLEIELESKDITDDNASADGSETIELDLSLLQPVRKGWKLLGWLVTTSGENVILPEVKTFDAAVTGIAERKETVQIIDSAVSAGTDTGSANAAGDSASAGSSGTEASGTGSAVNGETQVRTEERTIYELTASQKRYHYEPNATIAITGEMTLMAVWIPEDAMIEADKAANVAAGYDEMGVTKVGDAAGTSAAGTTDVSGSAASGVTDAATGSTAGNVNDTAAGIAGSAATDQTTGAGNSAAADSTAGNSIAGSGDITAADGAAGTANSTAADNAAGSGSAEKASEAAGGTVEDADSSTGGSQNSTPNAASDSSGTDKAGAGSTGSDAPEPAAQQDAIPAASVSGELESAESS